MISIKGMVLKELLKYTIGKTGSKIFETKASKVTPQEIKKLVKGLNDRLYKMEKTGWAEDSQLYSNLTKYMKEQFKTGKTGIFNQTKEGKVRISSDISRFGMTQEEVTRNINYLRNYLTAKTSTSTGTKKALRKRYESFIQRPDITNKNLTFEQYKEVWKTYREHVAPDSRERYGSDVVLSAIKEFDFYDMPQEKLAIAFDYVDKLKSIEKSSGLVELFSEWKKGGLIVGEI